ncbi:MAG TPA: hypothetical protein VD994_02405 [Prosthecobacter sp.]|nr:hypothetical protein [Prosthecobacter sp.]
MATDIILSQEERLSILYKRYEEKKRVFNSVCEIFKGLHTDHNLNNVKAAGDGVIEAYLIWANAANLTACGGRKRR